MKQLELARSVIAVWHLLKANLVPSYFEAISIRTVGLMPSTTSSYTARSIAEIPPAPRTLKTPFTRSQLHLHLLLAAFKAGAPPGSKLKGNSEWMLKVQVRTIILCYIVTV